MRIVSLLPSATEIVAALGLGGELVGISHECDFPTEVVVNKPIITRSVIPPGLEAAEVDRLVAERIRQRESLYTLDEELLETLKPDLILTQELCDVCAVSFETVRDAACRLSSDPRVISLESTNIAGILETIAIVGDAAGVPSAAQALQMELTTRLTEIRSKTRNVPHPRAYAMEWLYPPFSAGHWVPEMVEIAGGHDVLARAGERSMRLSWEQVFKAAPEFIFLMPCGYSVEMIEREVATIAFPSDWWDIPAIRRGNLFAVEANAYFSRPAPRVVEGIELLASLMHPEIFPEFEDSMSSRLVTTQIMVA